MIQMVAPLKEVKKGYSLYLRNKPLLYWILSRKTMSLRPPWSLASPEISFSPWRQKHFAIINITMGKGKGLPNK